MKIRLISDLHIDINHKYPIDLHKNGANDVFTLVAGDVCGSPEHAIKWIKDNIHQGAIVAGNHDVYDTDKTIEETKELFHHEFPENSNITYFDSDVDVISKDISDDVLLVADVLYTDYALPVSYRNASGDINKNMWIADPWQHRNGGMNDFNYGTCKTKYDGINDVRTVNIKRDDAYRLVPQWYLDHHKRAFAKMTDVIEKNQDKQIIVMAHHGLSPQCLDKNYNDDSGIDASYTSDKEKWIKSHPNIKCVVSGHIHCRKSFKVGDCLYVMNALGYCSQHLMQYCNETKKYEMWTPDCFIYTDSWTVSWNHSTNEDWERQKKIDDDKFMRLAPFFI